MHDDDFFWQGLAEGKLLLRHCGSCGTITHPPVPVCPKCHVVNWREEPASGRATVERWIMSRHPARPEEDPRIVAKLKLEEGPILVSNLQNVELGEVYSGMPVEFFVAELDGAPLHQFRPVAGQGR